jgi:hypothetical protein
MVTGSSPGVKRPEYVLLTTRLHTANELVLYFRLPSEPVQVCHGVTFTFEPYVSKVFMTLWFAGRSGKIAMTGISHRLNYRVIFIVYT